MQCSFKNLRTSDATRSRSDCYRKQVRFGFDQPSLCGRQPVSQSFSQSIGHDICQLHSESKLCLVYQAMLKRNLRHSSVLHFCVFLAGPSSLQSFPPFDGGGLVQVLVSVCVPPPHVLLHLEADHLVYPPSVARIKAKESLKCSEFLHAKLPD